MDKLKCQYIETPTPYDLLKDGDLCPGYEYLPHIWSFRCPVCHKAWSMKVPEVHQIISLEPLTINPSWLCPGGCHYFIRDGYVQ